jgi:hypothetical protein
VTAPLSDAALLALIVEQARMVGSQPADDEDWRAWDRYRIARDGFAEVVLGALDDAGRLGETS